jgi:hypothetical protein
MIFSFFKSEKYDFNTYKGFLGKKMAHILQISTTGSSGYKDSS